MFRTGPNWLAFLTTNLFFNNSRQQSTAAATSSSSQLLKYNSIVLSLAPNAVAGAVAAAALGPLVLLRE